MPAVLKNKNKRPGSFSLIRRLLQNQARQRLRYIRVAANKLINEILDKSLINCSEITDEEYMNHIRKQQGVIDKLKLNYAKAKREPNQEDFKKYQICLD